MQLPIFLKDREMSTTLEAQVLSKFSRQQQRMPKNLLSESGWQVTLCWAEAGVGVRVSKEDGKQTTCEPGAQYCLAQEPKASRGGKMVVRTKITVTEKGKLKEKRRQRWERMKNKPDTRVKSECCRGRDKVQKMCFPRGSVVNNLPAMQELQEAWVRSLRGGHDNPLWHSCLQNPHGWRILAGYRVTESDTAEVTEHACTHTGKWHLAFSYGSIFIELKSWHILVDLTYMC